MSRIISHPFRLGPNGSVVTVEQDSEQADIEQVAVLALTVIGERPLTPGFGITDPAFAGVIPAEIAAGVATFGPPVNVSDVTSSPLSDGQLVEVTFE